MAVPIKEFKITEVKQPNIGEVKPSSVTADVTFSISSYKAQIRSEWNALKEHDVLFLLLICPSFEPLSAEEAAKASVPQRLGLQYVRGCEIIEVRDEEGTLMNDFTGRIKRDEWKPPKGELRTVTVALDTAQYHMDVSNIAEKGADDVYGTFNILMRRKPKENNFKAILESIRDLMNEYCIVPDWLVRGCEIIEVRDEEGTLMNDFTGRIKRDEWKPPKGELRTVTVALDTAQYHMDVSNIAEKGADDVYGTFNILMRRKPKENNFKAILESIRDLMNEYCIVPDWLHNVFLGYGNPSAAQWTNMPDLLEMVDFKDTFLDADHLKDNGSENLQPMPPFRIRLPKTQKGGSHALTGNKISGVDSADGVNMEDTLIVEAYTPPDPGPNPQDQPKQNSVRFTPTQIGAIISGIQPGLTMGKTDTAVQILNVLYQNCPSQRTLIITHSNQALNDLFEKIMQRDVPAHYLLRLGQGEQELATDLDFSRQGRVNAMLVQRLELLGEVERLARSLQLPEDVGYTCETAGYFWLLHVYSHWEQFLAACAENEDKPTFVKDHFPFKEFFSDTPHPIFMGESFEKDMRAAKGCFRHLKTMFQELEECRAFELLKSTAD
ncbi:rna helicase aquarius [Quercus suber]|uniref:Rna helicase aquarius n=1 Tax=Quercus suber TaxID=58331 RepID=A0AAW0LZY1_QUESU